MASSIMIFKPMSLPTRLIDIRKARNLTQQEIADLIGIHVNSVKKYETGQAQPSIDVLKKIALSLSVSTDSLLFEEHERGPDKEFLMQFEAISQLPEQEKMILKELIDGMIIKYQTRRWDTTREA